MTWVPKLDFDNDVVSLEPITNSESSTVVDENTFHPRPKAHYEYAARRYEQTKNIPSDNSRESKQLRIIAKIQNMTRTASLDKSPSLDDWKNKDDIEAETIAMMRHLGLGPTLDAPLNEGNTVPSLPIPDELYVMKSGQRRMPIYFGEEYFKLDSENKTLDVENESERTNTTSSTNSSFATDEQNLISSSSGKSRSSNLRYELLKVKKNASWSTISSGHSYEVYSEGLSDLSLNSSYSASGSCKQLARVSLNLGDFIVTTTKQKEKKNKKKLKVITPKQRYEQERSAKKDSK